MDAEYLPFVHQTPEDMHMACISLFFFFRFGTDQFAHTFQSNVIGTG